MPFISLSKAPCDAGQAVVQLGRVAVQAEGDLAETGLDGRQVELALREHVAVGDRLHPVVADLPRVADEVDELRMDRALAARQDDLVGVQLVAPAPELLVDVVLQEVHVARRVGVEAEHAAAVARRDEPYPVLPDVGDALARQHPFRQLSCIHRSDLAFRCHPIAVPGQPITVHAFPSSPQLAKAPTGSEPRGRVRDASAEGDAERRPCARRATRRDARSSRSRPASAHRQCGSTANNADRAAPAGKRRAHSTTSSSEDPSAARRNRGSPGSSPRLHASTKRGTRRASWMIAYAPTAIDVCSRNRSTPRRVAAKEPAMPQWASWLAASGP